METSNNKHEVDHQLQGGQGEGDHQLGLQGQGEGEVLSGHGHAAGGEDATANAARPLGFAAQPRLDSKADPRFRWTTEARGHVKRETNPVLSSQGGGYRYSGGYETRLMQLHMFGQLDEIGTERLGHEKGEKEALSEEELCIADGARTLFPLWVERAFRHTVKA